MVVPSNWVPHPSETGVPDERSLVGWEARVESYEAGIAVAEKILEKQCDLEVLLSSRAMIQPVDILAIAAHRDDVEQTCGGTLLKSSAISLSTAILDLTQGEAGTRGTAAEREAEANDAARILGVQWRHALDLPDGRLENIWENRLKIARVLREAKPRVVILPYWQARHPDHAIAATLGYEACFVAGLAKVETGAAPHRPFKIVYASLYADVRPSFVVDITEHMEQRFQSLMAYRSQYRDQSSGDKIFVPHEEIRERTFALARFYGMLGGVRYAEPFVQKEVGVVEDLTLIPVQSI